MELSFLNKELIGMALDFNKSFAFRIYSTFFNERKEDNNMVIIETLAIMASMSIGFGIIFGILSMIVERL